jgi:ectoine hydroxylase-related dioxygenase (phytanoyl-CoA dioxygenase family)
MSGLVTLPASASVAEVCAVLDRDGGVIVEDMVSQATMDALWADLEPYLDQTPFGEEGFSGPLTRRCCALMAKSMHSAAFLMQPHFLGAAKFFLEEEYQFLLADKALTTTSTVQLSVTQAIQIWPGEAVQVLHRDDHLHHRHHPGPDSQIQTLFATCDFTEENGATRVIPGSHLWNDQRIPLPKEAVPAIMKRGSGLIYRGGTYHSGGANHSSAPRTALAFSIARGYLRQEENQYLVIPRDIVKQYPKEVQDMLGYKVCEPFCGWVEMQDTSIVLQDQDFTVAAARNLF